MNLVTNNAVRLDLHISCARMLQSIQHTLSPNFCVQYPHLTVRRIYGTNINRVCRVHRVIVTLPR